MKTWLGHPGEDALEEYAFHRLGESQVASLEEHLLVCELCQAELQQIDEFVLAMQQGAAELDMVAVTGAGWQARLFASLRECLPLTPGRAALAGVMVVLCAAAFIDWPRANGGPPVAVKLTALRGNAQEAGSAGGGGQSAAGTAPAGRPLALSIEVPDLAPQTPCRVEIVNATGRTAWSGSGAISEGRVAITALIHLGPGVYWVRVYTGGPDPVREFGLRLE